MTEDKSSKQRAATPKEGAIVYRRTFKSDNLVFEIHAVDGGHESKDLENFHKWHNDDRVAASWDLKGSKDEHQAALRKVLDDPHTIPMIGSFNGEPFAYFEVYWAADDHLAKYAPLPGISSPIDHHDRGVHLLVGEAKWRGPQYIRRWLPSLLDYCFSSSKDTQTIWSEPRASNEKVIEYMEYSGLLKQREFDFPHKRAALMRCSRNEFYARFGSNLDHLEEVISEPKN